MVSEEEICNMAIRHLGSGKVITALATEKGPEASACRTYYENTRDEALRDFAWPFAMNFVSPGLVETDPTTEWAFSYQYPSDCVLIRRIMGLSRNPDRTKRTPFRLAQGTAGTVILTDYAQAEIEYTSRVKDPVRYSPDFTKALSFLLASYLAPTLTGGDPFKMGDRASNWYRFLVAKAKAAAAGEEQPDEEPESIFITGRG